jgi:hypothetical protein
LRQFEDYLKVFQDHPKFGYTVVSQDSREFIVIKPHGVGTENKVSSYPGGQSSDFKNLRGMGTKLMGLFIDESDFFAAEGFPVILPLLANGAFLVMTSSVGGGGARVGARKLLEAQYADGSLAVKELNWIRPCDACVQKGLHASCSHSVPKPQFFQRRADAEKLRALMSPFEGAFEKEMQNVGDKPTVTPAFMDAWIAPLKDRSKDIDYGGQVRHVQVTVDPGGYGFSQTCIISTVRVNTNGKRKTIVRPFLIIMRHGIGLETC